MLTDWIKNPKMERKSDCRNNENSREHRNDLTGFKIFAPGIFGWKFGNVYTNVHDHNWEMTIIENCGEIRFGYIKY